MLAIAEGHGDTALVLLKAGAEVDKRDVDGHLAIELAPDPKVGDTYHRSERKLLTPFTDPKVHLAKCRARRHRRCLIVPL